LNLKEGNLLSLYAQIINKLEIEYLINIIYGRILTIISNNQLLNNKTYQVDVTLNLGTEMVNKYILNCYKQVRKSNPNKTYHVWKLDNPELINKTGGTQFKFELGNVLIKFMLDLKLIKAGVKILAKVDKKSILVAGPELISIKVYPN